MSKLSPSDNWTHPKFGDIVPEDRPICYGVLKPGPEEPNGVPLIRIVDIDGDRLDPQGLIRITRALDAEFARSRVEGGEILLSIQGTIGRVALVPKEAAGANISRTIARIAVKPEIDSRYVRHWLLSNIGQKALQAAVLGTTRDSLNIGALRQIQLQLPEEREQRTIAAILDTIDAAIQQTDALIAKLRQIKAGLLHDLLTRGLDDNGELRDPVAHPEQFKDSALGRIPREWKIVPLEEILTEFRNGYAFPSSRYVDAGYPVLRMTNIAIEGRFHMPEGSTKYCSEADYRSLVNYHVGYGDLVIAMTDVTPHRGIIGRAVIVDVDLPFILNQRVGLLIEDRTKVDKYYLQAFTNAALFRKYSITRSGASAQANLSTADIRDAPVLLPSLVEQKLIVSVLRSDDISVRREEATRNKLALLKRGLMDDLLTGRVRVTDLKEE